MPKFHVTIGQRYRNEGHPIRDAHPDGVIEVDAETIDEARDKVRARCGDAYHDIHEAEKTDFDYYPQGVVAYI